MGTTDASLEELKGAAGRPKVRIVTLLEEAAAVDHSSTKGEWGASFDFVSASFVVNQTTFSIS